MSDGSDEVDVSYQLREGGKSMARVAAATGLGGPAVGGAVLLFEALRTVAIGLAGEDGNAAASAADAAMDAGSAIERLTDSDR